MAEEPLRRAIIARHSYHHGNLALALVEEATRMVEAEGLRRFSLRACAKSLGVDVAAVYRHHASKDALLAAVAEHGSHELVRRILRAIGRPESGAPAEQFVAIGRAYVGFAVARPTLYEAVFALRARDARASSTGTPPRPSRRCASSPPGASGPSAWQLLGDCLDRMVEAGEIDATTREGADLVAWAAVHGLATLINQGLIDIGGGARERLAEQVCRTVLAGLRNAAPGSAPRHPHAPPREGSSA